jgi:outer membrane protein assembly factor BamB
VLWQRDLNEEYKILAADRMPIWGIAGAPLVYKQLLIVHLGGDEGACVVALDKTTGKEVWRALKDRAQYTAPIMIEQGGKPVVVCWTGDSVAGLDPESGKVYWREVFTPRNMPIGIATPILDAGRKRLFVTSFYDGSLMLGLKQDRPAIEKLWQIVGESERKTEALHSIISTPLFLGDYIYGVDSYGELRCLKADTGERVWEDLTATPKARWSTIHFVQNGELTWMFNERGQLLIGKLSPAGFEEVSRAKLLEPTLDQLGDRGGVCWSHPAFANKCIFARNDKELVCASLAAGEN